MTDPLMKAALAQLVKAGFTDSSYGNDCCPSAECMQSRIKVWLDYDKFEDRETDCEDDSQFSAYMMDINGSPIDDMLIVATDDIFELVSELIEKRKLTLMQRETVKNNHLIAVYDAWCEENNISNTYSAADLISDLNVRLCDCSRENTADKGEIMTQVEWLQAFELVWGL